MRYIRYLIILLCFMGIIWLSYRWGKQDADRWWQTRCEPVKTRLKFEIPSGYVGCSEGNGPIWVEKGSICHADPEARKP
jgi:hypothetical protein